MRFLFAFAAVIGLSCTASADLVGTYNFTGLTGLTSSVTGTPGTGVSLSTLSRGSGLTVESASNGFNSSGWTNGASIDVNDYYTFTVTPNSGVSLALSRVSFDEQRSNSGIITFEIRSSLDNYGSAIPGTITTVPDNAGSRSHSYSLPASFASLTSPTTFHIYGYKSEATGGTWRLLNYTGNAGAQGGLTIEGLAAVPEPSAILFGGLVCCAFGLTAARRRIMAWFSGCKPTIND